MPRTFLSLLVLFFLTGLSLRELHVVRHQVLNTEVEAEREVLYLPNGKALETVSFGFENIISDILWFKTISYFGKHYKTDRNYDWLGHMCELVTDLDSRVEEVFEFCGTMLAWEAGQLEKSQALLTKGIKSDPTHWNYLYLRGFNSMYFLEDPAAAKKDFVAAATIPGAPAFLARLAAQKMVASDPNDAIRFLAQMIENTEDPSQHAVLEDKYREAVFARDRDVLEQAVSVYKTKTGRELTSLQELIDEGIVAGKVMPLNDPFGGKFIFNPETKHVESSTGRKSRKKP